MNLTIPVYVQELKPEGARRPVFAARPLFMPQDAEVGEDFNRLMARLKRTMEHELTRMAAEPDHQALAAVSYNPPTDEHVLALHLSLKRGTIRALFLVVVWEALGRTLGYVPDFPTLFFEIDKETPLKDRVTEVLTHHLRQLEREEDDLRWMQELSSRVRAFTAPLEVHFTARQMLPRGDFHGLVSAGGNNEALDGAQELRRVGRCLEDQYPDGLARTVGRERELEELRRVLENKDRRPVLLVGPRQVGKSAIIQHAVALAKERGGSSGSRAPLTWLLAPERLISGMKYVGQWENRLLAILEESAAREHTLYFDDLPGLFSAGRSRDSSLNVAQVLKGWLEKRQVRVLGEATPEAFRVVQERDRGLADLFHVIPVRETAEDATLKVLISASRRLEGALEVQFEPEVLPYVVKLQRRFAPDAAFPGRAITVLERLAKSHPGARVGRQEVLAELQSRTGLSLSFLDEHVRLKREEIIEALSEKVVGQEAALNAMADLVSVARARLSDPARPLGTFLFLGPTGVGKTWCARTFAEWLYGDPARLLRFDMNEYLSSDAVARLVGTFDQPDGLLTSAVRRQPFSVILLDEIEKAHPDVFDLLLQVMGEGRLTDSHGRTADFTNAILILTSNLGVREAMSKLGFLESAGQESKVYVDAAQAFFAPEFFNRLDRIIPFKRLTRDHVAQIARRLVGEILSREGFARRRCALEVHELAIDALVDRGYDPVLGARALKRALERELVEPVSGILASMPPDKPLLLSVFAGPNRLLTRILPLIPAASRLPPRAAPPPDETSPRPSQARARSARRLRTVEELLERLEQVAARLETYREGRGKSLEAGSEPMETYLSLREELEALRGLLHDEGERHDARRFPELTSAGRRVVPPHKNLGRWERNLDPRELWAAADLDAYLREVARQPGTMVLGSEAEEIGLRVSLLERMLDWLEDGPPAERALLEARSLTKVGHTGSVGKLLPGLWLAQRLHHVGTILERMHAYAALTDLSDRRPGPRGKLAGPSLIVPRGAMHPRALLVEGPRAFDICRFFEGCLLQQYADGRLDPVFLRATRLQAGEDAKARSAQSLAEREAWLEGLKAGTTTLDQDPWLPGELLELGSERQGKASFFLGRTYGNEVPPAGQEVSAGEGFDLMSAWLEQVASASLPSSAVEGEAG